MGTIGICRDGGVVLMKYNKIIAIGLTLMVLGWGLASARTNESLLVFGSILLVLGILIV